MKWLVVVLLCCGWISSVFALGDAENSQNVENDSEAIINQDGNVTVNKNKNYYNYYNISPEKHAEYTSNLGLTGTALDYLFKILEQNKVDRADLDKKLGEIAENYKKMLELENDKLLEGSDDPEVNTLLRQARESIEGKDAQGNSATIDFAKAEALLQQAGQRELQHIKELQQIEEKAKAAREKKHVSAAGIRAQHGKLLDTQLKYAEAADYYQQVAKLLPEGSEKDKGDYLNNAGLALYHAGKYQQARPLYQEALKIREHVLDKRQEDYAKSLGNLALLNASQGQYDQAIPFYQKGLEIYEQILDKQKNSDYAEILNNLAELHREQGRYDQSLQLHQKALEIRKHILDKPEYYAESLNNLALLYKALGQYEQVLPLHEEASKIYEQALGGQHPYYALSLNNLALFYKEQRQYERALPLYQKASEIFGQALGKQHPYYVTSLGNLANLYSAQGKYEHARPLYQEALKICEHLGQHKDCAISFHNLAYFYSSQGEYKKALPLFQQAVKIQTKLSGEENPHRRIFAKNLRRVQDYLSSKYQVVVEQIVPGSSVSLLGIEIGDIFTHYNQQPILGKSQFTEKFAKEFADTIGEFKLLRDGKMLTFQLKPNEIEVELEEKLKSEP